MQDSDCWHGCFPAIRLLMRVYAHRGHIDCQYDLFSRDLMLMMGPGRPGECLLLASENKKQTAVLECVYALSLNFLPFSLFKSCMLQRSVKVICCKTFHSHAGIVWLCD